MVHLMLDKILAYHKKPISINIIIISLLSSLSIFVSIIYLILMINRSFSLILLNNIIFIAIIFTLFTSFLILLSYLKNIAYPPFVRNIIIIGAFVVLVNILLIFYK